MRRSDCGPAIELLKGLYEACPEHAWRLDRTRDRIDRERLSVRACTESFRNDRP